MLTTEAHKEALRDALEDLLDHVGAVEALDFKEEALTIEFFAFEWAAKVLETKATWDVLLFKLFNKEVGFTVESSSSPKKMSSAASIDSLTRTRYTFVLDA